MPTNVHIISCSWIYHLANVALWIATQTFICRNADTLDLVPCWTDDALHSNCCRYGTTFEDYACFDSIYTRVECCSTGYALASLPNSRFLEADPRAAWRSAQRRFERLVQNASRSQVITTADGSSLILKYFKRWDLHTLVDISLNQSVFQKLDDRMAGEIASSTQLWAIDIGASIGLASLILLKRYPLLKILAIEPSPSSLRYLLWNLRLNNMADRLYALNVGIGAVPSISAAFHEYLLKPTQGSYDEAAPGAWRPASDHRALEVPIKQLGQILHDVQLPLDNVVLIKLDCEGCEWNLGDFHELWQAVEHDGLPLAVELHYATNISADVFHKFCGDSPVSLDDLNYLNPLNCLRN